MRRRSTAGSCSSWARTRCPVPFSSRRANRRERCRASQVAWTRTRTRARCTRTRRAWRGLQGRPSPERHRRLHGSTKGGLAVGRVGREGLRAGAVDGTRGPRSPTGRRRRSPARSDRCRPAPQAPDPDAGIDRDSLASVRPVRTDDRLRGCVSAGCRAFLGQADQAVVAFEGARAPLRPLVSRSLQPQRRTPAEALAVRLGDARGERGLTNASADVHPAARTPGPTHAVRQCDGGARREARLRNNAAPSPRHADPCMHASAAGAVPARRSSSRPVSGECA